MKRIMRGVSALALGGVLLSGGIALAGQAPSKTETPAKKVEGAPLYDVKASGTEQIQKALTLAKRDKKRVLLQFGANWCGWCHKLHGLFASDSTIAAELKKNYVVVLIDVDKEHNADINKKYGNPIQFGLPVIVVLDSQGKQLTTQDTGKLEEGDHHSPDKVLTFLRKWAPAAETQSAQANAH